MVKREGLIKLIEDRALAASDSYIPLVFFAYVAGEPKI